MRAELLNVWHGLTDIAGIVKSSEGHPGGCPFSLAFLEPPCGRREGAGALRKRGLGAAFPPFQQPAGRSRNPPAIESAEKPSTWRKRRTDLPGFPTFRQAPGRSRNPPPIEMLKTPVFSGNHRPQARQSGARRSGSVEGGERRVGGSTMGGWLFLTPHGFAGSLRGAVACAPSD